MDERLLPRCLAPLFPDDKPVEKAQPGADNEGGQGKTEGFDR